MHGPSTERVDVEATWTQQEDDVAQPGPDDADPPERHAVACTLPILAFEDIALLSLADNELDIPGIGRLRIHRARHECGDTRHRVVTYSSGDGELLGVVIGELGDDPDRGDATSQWGADPVWHGRAPARRAISVELDQLFASAGRELPARPVRPLVQLPLVDIAREPTAGVLGYRPEYPSRSPAATCRSSCAATTCRSRWSAARR